MGIAQDFYSQYDAIIRRVCGPYDRFLQIGADALPVGIGSFCELGVGTGNFSRKVKDRFPHARMYGVDQNRAFLQQARTKIPDGFFVESDLWETDHLPAADYLISSLTLHHLPPATRNEHLLRIVRATGGLVTMDFFVREGRTKRDLIAAVSEFARSSFSAESVGEIAHEIETRDHPALLSDDLRLFREHGFSCDVLADEFPYVVYHVRSPR